MKVFPSISSCLLPQKLFDFSVNWQMYLSSAPRICAPTPVKR
uniref:Uncharacterized protein n=1 Tax=Arundo donax TaxID=35708 RepID=A0A0A8YGC0_ARUDO